MGWRILVCGGREGGVSVGGDGMDGEGGGGGDFTAPGFYGAGGGFGVWGGG